MDAKIVESDVLSRTAEKQSMEIIENLKQFDVVEFTWKDIVRSDFVRDYIMTKEMHGIK